MAELVKIAEVAERIGVSTETIEAWEDNGDFLKSKVLNGVRMYHADSLEAYLNFEQATVVTGDLKVLKAISKELVKRALKDGVTRQILFKSLAPEMFQDELYALYNIMYLRRGRAGGAIDKQYLTILLGRKPEFILNNPNIDLSIFADSETDTELAFTHSVLKYYDKFMEEDNTEEELELLVDKFLEEYKYLRVAAFMDNASAIFKTGIKKGRKQYKGADDTIQYLTESFTELDAELNRDQGQGIIRTSEVGMIDDERTKSIKVGDFGDLSFLTDLYGGVRTGMFYSITAPPKSGKSKFCFRLAYISMTKYRQNIVFWPREGGTAKLMAELRVIHFHEYYNEGADGGLSLDAMNILADEWPSPEIKQLEAVSRADLFASGKYGEAIMIDKPLLLETFEAEIKEAVNKGGCSSVYVDYLALIVSQHARLSKSEVIGSGYQRALTLCKDLNVAFFSPAQLKQEFIKAMVEGKDTDARIGGGESSEIVRTPDVNIALYSTPERLSLENELDLLSIPSRNAKAFERRTVYADLGKAYFSDIMDD